MDTFAEEGLIFTEKLTLFTFSIKECLFRWKKSTDVKNREPKILKTLKSHVVMISEEFVLSC